MQNTSKSLVRLLELRRKKKFVTVLGAKVLEGGWVTCACVDVCFVCVCVCVCVCISLSLSVFPPPLSLSVISPHEASCC